MHMNWFMLIGIEEYKDSQVFKYFLAFYNFYKFTYFESGLQNNLYTLTDYRLLFFP